MFRSQQARRRSRAVVSRGYRAALAGAIDVLESRRLFSGETAAAIPAVLADTTTPSTNSITLNRYFTDANLPGTLVTFKTNLGTITVSLTDAATPNTVANFLSYVSSGAYTDTIFHRTASFTNASNGKPTDIIQGGGFVISGRTFAHIPTNAPVADEYTTELFGDIAGTLAMAKTSSANTATSEWYFNVHDNTSALDTPTTDSNGVTTSYTVFGKVLTGMNVIDEIATLPAYNVSGSLGLTNVPVTGLTPGEVTKKFPISADNFVYTQSITDQPGVDYTVTSSDPSLVTPTLTNGVLSFTYATGKAGTARITVLAKSLDGTSASTSFGVTVAQSTTTAVPTAGDVTAPPIVTGTTANVSVLASDSDSAAALNQSSVAIVTQPTHGTATVNASTGQIAYTPTAGYLGDDTLTYTVADDGGTVSDPGTVTLDVVQAPVTITIGAAAARSLTFTQPSGAVGHLFIKGGTAKITFASSFVTTTTSAGVVSASGQGATIASIVVTNSGEAASLSLTATGAIAIGSIADNLAMSSIDAPNATITTNLIVRSIKRLVLAGATDATLSLGDGVSTALILPNAVNTTLTDTGSIASLTSTAWTNTDGGFYSLTTPSIGKLLVTGIFADVLSATSTGQSLRTSTIGQATSAWTVNGAIGTATFGTPATGWSLAAGNVGSLNILGNLANNISTGSIAALHVTGTTTGVTLTTTAATAERFRFGGAISNSNLTIAGNLASLAAPSLSTVNVSGGVIGSVLITGGATSATIKATQTTASNAVQISSVKVGGALDSSTIDAPGKVAAIAAGSLSGTTIDTGLIGSLLVSGASASATIQTNKTLTGKGQVQIGTIRLGGAVTSSSVSTSGQIGQIIAASLTGTQIVGGSISSVIVTGATGTTTITTDAAFSARKIQIGSLTFDGAVTSSTVNAVGNIGQVFAASLATSFVYAGVSSATTAADLLPANAGDFTVDARIASVVLGKGTAAFASTIISAEQIGTAALGKVTSSNSTGTTFGLGASKISAVSATLVPGGTIDARPAQLKSAAALVAYEKAAKVTLGDFIISLV